MSNGVRRLRRILCALGGATLLGVGCLGAFGYRRFCRLDSRFYQPRADTVIRLVIERSFERPVSFTLLERAGSVRLETFVVPDRDRDGLWGHRFWRTRRLTPDEWATVQALVAQTKARFVANEHQPLFCDGSTWHLSIRTKAGLDTVTRRCPESFRRDERYRALCALGVLFSETAGWPLSRESLVGDR